MGSSVGDGVECVVMHPSHNEQVGQTGALSNRELRTVLSFFFSSYAFRIWESTADSVPE